jgi:hypothetical protein
MITVSRRVRKIHQQSDHQDVECQLAVQQQADMEQAGQGEEQNTDGDGRQLGDDNGEDGKLDVEKQPDNDRNQGKGQEYSNSDRIQKY